MKRKVLSLFLTLILVLTACLVTAVPAAADPGVEITSPNVEGPYMVGVEQGFTLTTTSDATYSNVRFNFVVGGAVLADITSFQYYDWEFTQLWHDVPLSQNGSNLEGYFGPPGGFTMPAPYDATTKFKVEFSGTGAGTYPVTVSLVALGTPDTVIKSVSFSA